MAPVTDTFVAVPGVTYSFSADRAAWSKLPSSTAVEAIIKPFEIDRSEPSEGLFSMANELAPSALLPYVAEPPPSSSPATTQPRDRMTSACSYFVKPDDLGAWFPSALMITTLPSAVMPTVERGYFV